MARGVTSGVWAMAVAWVVAAPLPGQPRTADLAARGVSPADFPRFVPIATGVWAYEEVRSPGFTTVSLVVVGDSGVLIADGQGSEAATRRLLQEIRRLSPRPVRWYVFGSDHGDHTAGNVALPPGVTYLVHPTSRTQLERDAAAAMAAFTRAAADSAARHAPPPAHRVVVVPPVAMTTDRQRVDMGGRVVEVRFLGRAHTGGDLMVHLPDDQVLFMSEAYLNRVFPAMRSAFPSEWVRTIDAALALEVRHFIPGHGFVETPAVSREELVAFREALVGVIDVVRGLHSAGVPVAEAARRADWGQWKDWFLSGQQGPVAVRRIYDEIEGRVR